MPALGVDIARALVAERTQRTEEREACQLYVCHVCNTHFLEDLDPWSRGDLHKCPVSDCTGVQTVGAWRSNVLVMFKGRRSDT